MGLKQCCGSRFGPDFKVIKMPIIYPKWEVWLGILYFIENDWIYFLCQLDILFLNDFIYINKWVKLGKPYSLEKYRSLKEKEDLLDCALEMGDGDSILAVTLMIQRSLTNQKFLGILYVRPLAAEHLLNYLMTRFQHQQAMDLLTALGNFHQVGIVGYSKAITTKVSWNKNKYQL